MRVVPEEIVSNTEHDLALELLRAAPPAPARARASRSRRNGGIRREMPSSGAVKFRRGDVLGEQAAGWVTISSVNSLLRTADDGVRAVVSRRHKTAQLNASPAL